MGTLIAGGVADISTAHVQTEGITRLLRDAEAVGVSVADLRQLTGRLGRPIVGLARSLAPKGQTDKLAKDIRVALSKRAVRVVAGSKGASPRVPYAAVRHWGLDGDSGPRFLSVAEERLRPATIKGFADGITEILRKHDWT